MILGIYPNVIPRIQSKNNQPNTNYMAKTANHKVIPFGMNQHNLIEIPAPKLSSLFNEEIVFVKSRLDNTTEGMLSELIARYNYYLEKAVQCGETFGLENLNRIYNCNGTKIPDMLNLKSQLRNDIRRGYNMEYIIARGGRDLDKNLDESLVTFTPTRNKDIRYFYTDYSDYPEFNPDYTIWEKRLRIQKDPSDGYYKPTNTFYDYDIDLKKGEIVSKKSFLDDSSGLKSEDLNENVQYYMENLLKNSNKYLPPDWDKIKYTYKDTGLNLVR